MRGRSLVAVMVVVSAQGAGLIAQEAVGAAAPVCGSSEVVVPKSVPFRSSNPLSPLSLGSMAVDATNTNDLTKSPDRQREFGQAQQNLISFVWGSPVFTSQQRDRWGQAVNTTPDQPRLAFVDAWSPALGVHAGNIWGVPDESPFGPPKLVDTGFTGRLESKVIEGDPTGLSCDAQTVEDKAVGSALPRYNFSTRGARMVRSGVDLTWKWFPYSAFFVPTGATQFGYAEGTFRGRPIEMVGAFDRYYGVPMIYSALLAKRVIMVYAARGVDGKFEYGVLVGVKDVANKRRFGWAFAASHCRDGAGCVVSNRVELKGVKWERNPDAPHQILPMEGTYKFGGREIYMKAVGGFQPGRIKEAPGFVRPILPLAGAVTGALRWSDATGIWREKSSPDFDLSFNGIETYGLTLGDLRDLRAMTSD